MRGELPFIIFKTKKGMFAIDLYLINRVEKLERIATLIRRAENIKQASFVPKEVGGWEEEVKDFLKWLLEIARVRSGKIINKRLGKMRRWNIFRLLGIPTGHSRHVSEEERLARDNREALLALSILENVIKGDIKVVGYGVAEIEIKGKEVYINGRVDPVYTELIKRDMRAAMALLELVR
ncbi:hypothetical protein P8X24_09585 [Pyrococcus kukulkanii]|uniref:hypothetical protein n=1 Tax=Pyrococcus kukulkanii TaxID=1609559 RepID=UPI00356519D7